MPTSGFKKFLQRCHVFFRIGAESRNVLKEPLDARRHSFGDLTIVEILRESPVPTHQYMSFHQLQGF